MTLHQFHKKVATMAPDIELNSSSYWLGPRSQVRGRRFRAQFPIVGALGIRSNQANCMLKLNSKYISFVASVSVDVSLAAAQPSQFDYPRIVNAPKEAVAANLAHTGEPAGFCCTA